MTHHNDTHDHPHTDKSGVEPIMRPVEELEAEAQLGPAELMGNTTDGSVDGGAENPDQVVVPFSVGSGQVLNERPLPVVVDGDSDDQILVDEDDFRLTE